MQLRIATPVAVAMLAGESGALASGLGQAIWYRALPALKATQAATVQSIVPAGYCGCGWRAFTW